MGEGPAFSLFSTNALNMNPKLLWLLKSVGCGLIGGIVSLLVVGIWLLNDKPDLSIWHTARLDEEFTSKSKISNFEEYLKLEDRLFAQLEKEVYNKVEKSDQVWINRYFKDSVSNPGQWEQDWNRSFELEQDEPVAGVLLIHGLTDSPYSMRHVAEALHRNGAYVLALRVPGHGTSPSSLAKVKWQDMEAAVAIAARHVGGKAPGVPFHLVGYSNGGALAVRYSINSVKDSEMLQVDSMALLSPEIGVAKMAGFAIWQERIGKLLNLKKLRWTGVSVEYDPFKYSSFPVNGGILAHDLTKVNRAEMVRLVKSGKLGEFPRTIAFQSAVDATVLAPDLVRDFFFHLQSGGHELVVYDLNRIAGVEPILTSDPKEKIGPIIESSLRMFNVSVLTNETADSENVVELTWRPGVAKAMKRVTGLSWPGGIYSLSHVALPFPGDDPLYGGQSARGQLGVNIGSADMKGEKGAIKIPASEVLRLRWNPFYDYQEKRMLEHLGLGE